MLRSMYTFEPLENYSFVLCMCKFSEKKHYFYALQ